jgi:hypothetical protein
MIPAPNVARFEHLIGLARACEKAEGTATRIANRST